MCRQANPVGNLRNRVNSIERGRTLDLLATSLRFPVAAYHTDFNFFGASLWPIVY
jgi:hypothetical protein